MTAPLNESRVSSPLPASASVPTPLAHEDAESIPSPINITIDLPSSQNVDLPRTIAGEFQAGEMIPKQSESQPVATVDVPGYEILGELGRGGMGVVYKARQLRLNRIVALKMILTAEHAGPTERARFQIEAEAVAQLQHSNIVQIYDVGEVAGRPYFSLEFVDGGSLAQQIQGHPQSPRASAALIESVARAVAAAHAVGIVHRDLKPANILLARATVVTESGKSLSSLAVRAQHPFGIPKITDFGLAKRLEGNSGNTQSGAIMGTPSYMAPEQAAGKIKEIGPQTDVYSLGAILYDLLTGRPPFLAESPLETIMQVMSEEPVPLRQLQPKLPRDLEIICLKCLEKSPAKRYTSATELADDLLRYLEGEPISARPATRWERARKWVRRNPTGAALIALGTAALTAIAIAIYIYQSKLQAALVSVEKERDRFAHEQQLSHERNIRLTVANGTNALMQGDLLRALPYFTEALQLEGGKTEREEMHRIRIASVLRQCPRLTRAWFHEGRVNDAIFSPDHSQIATACEDGLVRIFSINDLDTDRPILTLQHPAGVLSVRFHPSRKEILTTSADHAARIWDLATGKRIGEPLQHDGPVTTATYDSRGTRILTTSADRTARLWDAETGEASTVVVNHSARVLYGEFSPMGMEFATAAEDGTARVWDGDNGKPVGPVIAHTGPVIRICFSPNGKWVFTASRDQTARVWDATTGEPITNLMRRSTPLTDAAFSPNGRDVVTTSTDGTVRVFDTAVNDWRTFVVKHDSPIVNVEYSPDGRAIATGGEDNTARVWESTRNEALTPPLRHNGTVHRVVFSADGTELLTASQDGLVRLWDIAAGQNRDTNMVGKVGNGERIAHSPDRRRMIRTGDKGEARICDAGTGEVISPILRHNAAILHAAFSPDGERVLTCSADRTARVWSAQNGAEIGIPRRHGSDVVYATFSPDGKTIATASTDNTARVWDTETGEPITPPLRHNATVTRVTFSPDGRCVLTTSEDSTARTWDATTGESLTPILKPTGWVSQVFGSGDLNAGWDLPADQRSVRNLVLQAKWLSAHRIDDRAGLVPMDSEQLHEVWNQLRRDYPHELVRSGDRMAWHRRQVEAAEAARDWFAAVFHLSTFIDEQAKATSTVPGEWYARRGRAWAEQSRWKHAAQDFAIALKHGATDEATRTALALTLLASGDATEHRKVVAELLDHYAESAHGESARRLVWLGVLIPITEKDNPLIQLDATYAGKHDNAGCMAAHGALMARLKKWQEAKHALTESEVFVESIDAPRTWLFLALAHHQMGNEMEAKHRLSQAQRWMAKNCEIRPKVLGNRPPALTWQQRLELEIRYREVDTVLQQQPLPKIDQLQK